MLVYHAFADINHGVFRALLMHEHVFGESIDVDYWRILDFLYLFPHEAKHIRVPRHLVVGRNAISREYNKYNDVRSPREFISRTASMHSTIAAILGAKGIVDTEELKNGKMVWLSNEWPEGLLELCDVRAEEEQALLGFLRELYKAVPTTGPDGIKARTNWMEHRYDT